MFVMVVIIKVCKMGIKIQKEKAIKIMALNRVINFLYGYVICILLLNGLFWFKSILGNNDFTFFFFNLYVLLICLAYQIFQYYNHKKAIDTLTYSLEEEGSKPIKCYEYYFSRAKDTAKLQVVNSVDICQDFYDKLFNVWSLVITYGFSGDGYTFQYNYLEREEAERVSKMIKGRGKLIQIE